MNKRRDRATLGDPDEDYPNPLVPADTFPDGFVPSEEPEQYPDADPDPGPVRKRRGRKKVKS